MFLCDCSSRDKVDQKEVAQLWEPVEMKSF